MRGLLGLAALLAIAWALSEDRRRIPWRTVIAGIALQWALALLLLFFPPANTLIFLLNDGATALQNATQAGTSFVFGYLGGPPLPFAETHPGASFILAFQALPLVLTISALASLLFHWGVLQRITAAFAWLLRRVMGIGGALALGAAVHVFVGMIEAPLLVRPYLARMQRGELFALMTCGMAAYLFKAKPEFSLGVLKKYVATQDSEVLNTIYELQKERLATKPIPYVRVVKSMMHLLSRTRPEMPAANPEGFVEARFIKELESAGFFEEMNRQYGK